MSRPTTPPCPTAPEGSGRSLREILTRHLAQLMEAEVRGDPEAVLALAVGLAIQAGEISEEEALAQAERDPELIADAFRASGWRPADEAAPSDRASPDCDPEPRDDLSRLAPPSGDTRSRRTGPRRRRTPTSRGTRTTRGGRYVGPVVYGAVPGGTHIDDECLVFIPRDRAAYLAAMNDVLQTATTWGECQKRLAPDAYQDLLEASGATERPDFTTFYQNERRRAQREGRRLSRREAWRAYTALDPDERQPLPDDPFDASRIGSYMDGDWPGWPKHEMVYWVPRKIQERFGCLDHTLFNGEFLEFSLEDEQALVEAFARHGYVCIRDDQLVLGASGYIDFRRGDFHAARS